MVVQKKDIYEPTNNYSFLTYECLKCGYIGKFMIPEYHRLPYPYSLDNKYECPKCGNQTHCFQPLLKKFEKAQKRISELEEELKKVKRSVK